MVDGTSMTFSVVSSPMELLPTEIKIEVLRHCPNTRSLRALTRASGLYFHAYVSTSLKIFTEVLLNEIATVGHSLENKSFFEFDSRHFTHEPHQQQHLESRYHRYRSLGWGLPSIRDSLALPVVANFKAESVIWDGDPFTNPPTFNTTRYLDGNENWNRVLGVVLQESFYDDEGKAWAPPGLYSTIIVRLEYDQKHIGRPPKRGVSCNALMEQGSVDSRRIRDDYGYSFFYAIVCPYKAPEEPEE